MDCLLRFFLVLTAQRLRVAGSTTVSVSWARLGLRFGLGLGLGLGFFFFFLVTWL